MLKTVSSVANALGALNYKGTWNASTNTPALASGVGTQGDYYVVSVDGATDLDGITNWGVGDWAAFNGSVWQRVEGGADGNFVNLEVTGDLTTYGNNYLEGSKVFQRNYADWPYTVFSRAQGTRASPTSIGNGQTLSEIYFSGYTNGQYRNGAKIKAKVSAGVSGDEIPTTLTFSTTDDGANSPTDRWAIDHTGNLVALQSGNGIDFSATAGTGTSELLSDYEEGLWTPTLTTDGTDFDSVTYDGVTEGSYTKVGNLVTCAGRIRTDAVTVGSGSGNVAIGGLPFTTATGGEYRTAASLGDVAAWAGDMPISGRVDSGTSRFLLLYRTAVNGATSYVATSDVGTGTNANSVYFSLFYYV